MKKVTDFENCCGCGQCVEICALDAIEMKKNYQGFYYPVVDEDKCVGCGACVKQCAFNHSNQKHEENSVIDAFAAKHINEEIRSCSRSGGVFTALSDWVLDNNGIVYGCKLINCREAIHLRATTKEERDAFRGSKYIQSRIFDCFKSVKEDLKTGKWVLFSGTPCQVNAIKCFCDNVDNEKLILIDIVCHGVPSQIVWSDYLIAVSKGKKIANVDFRDKERFGWEAHKETITFGNGEVYSRDIFVEMFYSHLILRSDCFQCQFKNLNRVGDITLADCWGIEENYPEFNDNKGVSLVLINTSKGISIWEKISCLEVLNVNLSKLMQPALQRNWKKPEEYDRFWKYYCRHSFNKVLRKFFYKKTSLAHIPLYSNYREIKALFEKRIRKHIQRRKGV